MVGLLGWAGLGGGGALGGVLPVVLLPGLVVSVVSVSSGCPTSTMVAVVRALLVAEWVAD